MKIDSDDKAIEVGIKAAVVLGQCGKYLNQRFPVVGQIVRTNADRTIKELKALREKI